jgi:alpha-glucosidase
MQLRPFILIFLFVFSSNIFAQSTASQQVITFEMEAPQLNTQKKIWVYVPKNYQNSKKAYNVIYMHDAQNLFDDTTSYVGEWKVDEYLDSVKDDEAIIVGIEHGNDKRIDELTPYPNEKYGGGKGDLYLDFIINSVKPRIDSIYRTLKDPKHTTIFGSSLGALISLYAVLKYPETFGNAGMFSSAFWVNPEIYDLVSASKINEESKFYFLVGSEEGETAEDAQQMIADQEKIVGLLQRKGVIPEHIMSVIIEGGKHNETLWATNFPTAFQWLIND